MDKPGWIKIYRKIFNGKWTTDDVGHWFWLLCAAEYDGQYRGSLITTVTSVAEEWRISRHRARSILLGWVREKRITMDEISVKLINFHHCTPPSPFAVGATQGSTHRGVVISIINYDIYQGSGVKSDASPCQPSENHSLENNKKRISSAQTVRSQKSEKKGGDRKKKGHPRHQEVVDYFYRRFKERFDREYIGQAKDFTAISRLLKTMDADDLMARINRYLKDEEPFLVKNGHSMALLQTRINAYAPGIPQSEDSWTDDDGYLQPAPKRKA